MGIYGEAVEKVFTPFFTTKMSAKKSGTGIGMYVVKRMVEESHRGRVWFESKMLEGTTIYIEIPSKQL